jgi:hypothetical protein
MLRQLEKSALTAALPSLSIKAKWFRNYTKLSILIKLIQNHKPDLEISSVWICPIHSKFTIIFII